MITVTQLNHFFGHFHALRNVNFVVPSGCITGFIGPNGAGKSTTLRALAGILIPQEGHVEIDGLSLVSDPLTFRRKIGYMQEAPVLYREMKIREYLDFVAAIKAVEPSVRRTHVDTIMGRCGIAHIQRRLIGNLSKGNRQRVSLAQALIGDPTALLLDEPTSAMDPAEVIRIRAFIRELQPGMSILLSSHILSEVAQICDRLIFIRDGEIRYDGPVQDVNRLEALFT